MNHRQQVGAMGDQRGGVVQGDTADHADRQFEPGAGLLQQSEIGSWNARLGHRIEETAKGDIAGAFAGGLFGQLQLGVASRADDCFAAKQCTRWCQRSVGLAQVDANAQAGGQFGIVVDDQAGLVARTEFSQGFGLAQAAGLVLAFVTVLQQGHTALKGGLDIGKKLAGQQLAVGNGIQTA
ncbi:hypothetical protein D3C72_1559920 [compost metagenome]